MKHEITIESGSTIRLPTAGKVCDRDIRITATGGTEDLNDLLSEQEAKLQELSTILDGKAAGTTDVYVGDYEVTPKVEAQTLSTANKILTKDVTVNKIPYAEVTNTAKGKTVTIG